MAPPRGIRWAVEAADAICQEQVGSEEPTPQSAEDALDRLSVPPEELEDIAVERAEDILERHGADPLTVGSLAFASAFISGVVYGRDLKEGVV